MTKIGLALVALLAFLGAVQTPASIGPASSGPLVDRKEAGHLVGVLRTRDLERLAQLDEATLQPRAGRRPILGRTTDAWAFAPDRSEVVFASQRVDGTQAFRFVDLATMQRRADLALPRNTYVQMLTWVAPRRLLALHTTPSGYAFTLVDPRRPQVLARRYFEGSVVNAVRSPGGLLILLGSGQQIGPSRLVAVDGTGRQRSVDLTEIWAGWEVVDEKTHLMRTRAPALAVDPTGQTAYVVDPDGRVAEVDLAALTLRYHRTSEPRSLLSRFASWLQPSAAAKAFEGPSLTARFLGANVLAVFGESHYAVPDPGDAFHEASRGFGLTLIDTRDWSSHSVDRTTSQAWVDANGVLAVANSCEVGACRGDGLTAYTVGGDTRFKLLAGKSVWVDAVYADHAYLHVSHERMRVVDLGTGAVSERAASLPGVLLDAAGPDWR